MSRAYSIAMKSPHAALGLPIPVGRKLEAAAKRTWVFAMAGLTIFFFGMYLYQVNQSASKSYTLRNLDTQRQELERRVADLENKSASIQSMATIEERLQNKGYVAVDTMEFLDVTRNAYAFAK